MPKFVATIAVPALLMLGCASGGPDLVESGPEGTDQSDGGSSSAQAEEQLELGTDLYQERCASCHGRSGKGGEGPALVGLAMGALPRDPPKGASRPGQFVTVADVAGFAMAAMPPAAKGSLEPEEYWAIVAFILSANGIAPEQELTPELAATLPIPRPAAQP